MDLPVPFEAHVANAQREVNGSIGGVALPQSITPTSAVFGLTNVVLMSARSFHVVARVACESVCGQRGLFHHH